MSSVTRPPSAGCSARPRAKGRRKKPFTNRTSGSQISGPSMPSAKWGEKSRVSESR